MQNFRTIKEEIRILAWDDGPFDFKKKGKDILIGVIYRGGKILDGMLKTEIEIDGLDSTERIIESTNKTKHKDLRVMMLDGITFGGFNTVDIKDIYMRTKLPVIVVNRKKPDLEKFKKSLKLLPEYEKRLTAVKNAGPFYYTNVKNRKICFQCAGLKKEDAEKIIKTTATIGLIPEPLRAAHLIATGIVLGESVGRA